MRSSLHFKVIRSHARMPQESRRVDENLAQRSALSAHVESGLPDSSDKRDQTESEILRITEVTEPACRSSNSGKL